MQSATQTAPVSKTMLWAGRIISVLVVLFLLFDALIKVMSLPPAIEGTTILGAILLTGYLGGAVATNLRVGNPLFTYILSPVYFGMLIWGGLFFRDSQLRALIPLRR